MKKYTWNFDEATHVRCVIPGDLKVVDKILLHATFYVQEAS